MNNKNNQGFVGDGLHSGWVRHYTILNMQVKLYVRSPVIYDCKVMNTNTAFLPGTFKK